MADPKMTPERWKQISSILDEALELPPEKVATFLEGACAGNAELCRQVQELLSAHVEANDFLKTPIADVAPVVDEVRRSRIPEAIGPYRIVRELGQGGMGVVYQAVDTRLQRPVAIKILPSGLANDTARDRFIHEARAVSALDHANICSIYDIGETDDGRLYIVMAYYAGETLYTRLQKGPLPVDEARNLALQIARGLERAHLAGIVHRDVKPGNIALTEHGEAKILDFGIAKVLDRTALTMTGTAPGTPAYMSPEQARGETVDARTDIFSLGVMLYEMLSGERPFRADNPQAMIYSILNSDPEPLERRRPDVPADLRRIVAKAMAKRLSRRYANMRELITDLKETGTTATVLLSSVANLVSQVRYRARGASVALATAVVLAAAGAWWWLQNEAVPADSAAPAAIDLPPPTKATPIEDRRTFLAVLPFENSTDSAQRNWLSESLSEMLTIELAQSPDIHVLDPRRLLQVVQETEGSAAAAFPAPIELVQELAKREGVRVILAGSYVYQGDTLRINFSLEKVDGELLASDSLQDRGEESVFALIDKLSAAVRNRFEVARTPAEPTTIQMVTTSSLDAWRLYSEGLALFRASKFQEAIPLFEKAIEIDPQFALALNDLAQLQRNLQNRDLARGYARRAVEQAERLPLHYRYLAEGNYYKDNWATYDKALEIFRKGDRQYPKERYFRRQIALLSAFLERYEQARDVYADLRREADLVTGASFAAASVYTALGESAPGERILADLARRMPEDWLPQAFIAKHHVAWGKLDKAEESLRLAFERRPEDSYLQAIDWYITILRQDWPRAEAIARTIQAKPGESDRWQGAVSSALDLVFRGRSEEALSRLAEAVEAQPGGYAALAHCWAAELRLARGEIAQAQREADLARDQGRDNWPELWGLFLSALAAERQGDSADADAAEKTLREKLQRQPNRFEERQLYRLTGLRAALRGDRQAAVAALRKAESLLPDRGINLRPYSVPDHVPLWVDLGEAELAAGDRDNALRWLLKASESGIEHADSPYAWVRSFYLLGRLYEEQGQEAEAQRYFQRFLDLWQDGDLDREEVEAARRGVQN